jgi:hypothetical protein
MSTRRRELLAGCEEPGCGAGQVAREATCE